jgi:hypothetical protein
VWQKNGRKNNIYVMLLWKNYGRLKLNAVWFWLNRNYCYFHHKLVNISFTKFIIILFFYLFIIELDSIWLDIPSNKTTNTLSWFFFSKSKCDLKPWTTTLEHIALRFLTCMKKYFKIHPRTIKLQTCQYWDK